MQELLAENDKDQVTPSSPHTVKIIMVYEYYLKNLFLWQNLKDEVECTMIVPFNYTSQRNSEV